MATIEDLQMIDLDKIKSGQLQKAIDELLQDYEREDEDDKPEFLENAKETISKLFALVEKTSPEAIAKPELADADDDGSNELKSRKKERKEKSKKAMEDIDEMGNEIEGCRKVIREYNKEKRKNKPVVKKTRLAKLKDKLLGIVSLIPEKLKDEKSVRDKTEKILMRTLNDIKKTWKMNVVKKAQEAIKEKFNQLDQKLEG